MNIINVAFASDNNYAQPMAVSIASLLKNALGQEEIHIYILHEDLSQENINRISQLKELRENTKIDFVRLTLEDFKDYPLHTGTHSIATYFRLKLPSLLPDVQRIAYLDSDIIVCANIQEAWDLSCTSNDILWAVEEPKPLYRHRLSSLGMKENSPYFNGGILFLNLERMRSENFEENSVRYLTDYKDAIFFQDQDILNALSEEKWSALPLKWNSFFFVLEGIYNNQYYNYKKEDVLEARNTPSIIHFNQHPKPWVKNCIDPRREAYFKYISYTPYADFNIPSEGGINQILKKKINVFILALNAHCPIIYKALRYIKRQATARN